jgi:hypothetical protein
MLRSLNGKFLNNFGALPDTTGRAKLSKIFREKFRHDG